MSEVFGRREDTKKQMMSPLTFRVAIQTSDSVFELHDTCRRSVKENFKNLNVNSSSLPPGVGENVVMCVTKCVSRERGKR